MISPQTGECQKFWDANRACGEESRVSPDSSPFYVRCPQVFARFLQEKRLQVRSGKDIQDFLAVFLAQQAGLSVKSPADI